MVWARGGHFSDVFFAYQVKFEWFPHHHHLERRRARGWSGIMSFYAGLHTRCWSVGSRAWLVQEAVVGFRSLGLFGKGVPQLVA
ncbi:hypothetical protein CDL15_Pgr001476 [Punica granatum]|uniref:Uncharacterized protein n=1 Tax=Punica granatum TaxID=22663 RepID=A0A218WMY2_PUNGR|nr:hypothetical protein CDL15_Pgr001476 [Punica granatum]